MISPPENIQQTEGDRPLASESTTMTKPYLESGYSAPGDASRQMGHDSKYPNYVHEPAPMQATDTEAEKSTHAKTSKDYTSAMFSAYNRLKSVLKLFGRLPDRYHTALYAHMVKANHYLVVRSIEST